MDARPSTARGYDTAMQDTGPFAAALIRAGTPAYAASAARRIVERQGANGFPFDLRKEGLSARLRDLSAALSDGNPALFAEQVRWNRAAYDARQVPVDRLREELEALREVFREELPDGPRGTVAAYLDAALDALDRPAPEEPRLDAGTQAGRTALSYVAALLEGDRREALRIVLEAVRSGTLSTEALIVDVLLPAQRELGRMWHANEISVAEEHFVTITTQAAMDRAMAYAKLAEPVGRTVLIAAAAGDVHDIGLQAAAHLYEIDGWRVVLLGADLPRHEIAQAVEHFEPDLLALGATIGWQRAAVAEAIAEARAARPVKVLVGGLAFHGDDALWKRVGADAFARTLRDGIAVGRKLVGLPPR